MSIRFFPDHSFDPKKIAGVHARLVEAGKAISDEAQHVGAQVSPTYKTSVHDDGDKVAVVATSNPLDAAGWIEFGTQKLPAYAPIRRGVEAAGLELRG